MPFVSFHNPNLDLANLLQYTSVTMRRQSERFDTKVKIQNMHNKHSVELLGIIIHRISGLLTCPLSAQTNRYNGRRCQFCVDNTAIEY